MPTNFLYTRKKKNYIFLIFVLVIFVIFFKENPSINSDISEKKENSLGINILDLNIPLEPVDVFEKIKCRLSQKVVVQTTLCIHDIDSDVFVSKSIWEEGCWEKDILSNFTHLLKDNPDWLVFDIGANLGI